jgi:hypothetical protein
MRLVHCVFLEWSRPLEQYDQTTEDDNRGGTRLKGHDMAPLLATARSLTQQSHTVTLYPASYPLAALGRIKSHPILWWCKKQRAYDETIDLVQCIVTRSQSTPSPRGQCGRTRASLAILISAESHTNVEIQVHIGNKG